MTIDEVVNDLCDDLDADKEFIKERLLQIMDEDKLSIDKLNEWCWEDSASVFDRIYG